MILQAISDFRDKKLDLPMQIIAEIGSKLIVDEDKVVVYAYSHVVHMILKAYAFFPSSQKSLWSWFHLVMDPSCWPFFPFCFCFVLDGKGLWRLENFSRLR